MAYQQILKTNTMIPQSESFNLPSTKSSASNQILKYTLETNPFEWKSFNLLIYLKSDEIYLDP